MTRKALVACLALLACASLQINARAQGRPDIQWMRGGHSANVAQVVRSADGQVLATAGPDSTVKIWRSSDDALLRTFPTGGAVGLSPDGTLLAVGHGPQVTIYDVATGASVRSITVPSGGAVAISPGNQYVAVAVNTNQTRMYRISDGSLVHDFGVSGFGGGSVAFSPDGLYLATGHSSGVARIVNVATGLDPRVCGVGDTSLTFSPDGQYLAGTNGGGPSVARVSDCAGVTLLSNSSTPYGSTVAFSPDGQYLAAGVGSFNVKRWSVSGSLSWASLGQFQAEPTSDDTAVTRVAFNAANQLITGGKLLRAWDPADGSSLRDVFHLGGEVPTIAFSPDGQTLATGVNSGNPNPFPSIHLWDAADGTPRNISFPLSEGYRVIFMAFTPDGQTLMTTGSPAPNQVEVRFWNAATGALLRTSPHAYGGPVLLSPDGLLYALIPPNTRSVNLYRVADDSLFKAISLEHGLLGHKLLAFSPDGSALVVSYPHEGFHRFYRVADGAVAGDLGAPDGSLARENTPAAFSPDGRLFAAAYEFQNGDSRTGLVRVWRVSDEALLHTLEEPRGWAGSLAFSPDGQTLASTSWGATARLWRVADGALLNTYDEETGQKISSGHASLHQIAYSPDGSRLAYGRADATVVVAGNPHDTGAVGVAGTVRDASGQPIPGVTVSAAGSLNASTTTDEEGRYWLAGLTVGGDFTVTPSAAFATFSAPTSRSYTNLRASQAGQDFTAARKSLTVSGRVLSGTAGVNGVAVRLTSDAPGFAPVTVTTATPVGGLAGSYSFADLPGGFDYTVEPQAGPVFSFTPGAREFAALSADQAGQDFAAARQTYTISGRVQSGQDGLGGLTLRLTSTAPGFTPRTATTLTSQAGVAGDYVFAGVPAGFDYTLTPVDTAVFTFGPAALDYLSLAADQTAQDFTAARRSYPVSGRVLLGAAGLNGVNVVLTSTAPGFAPRTATTATSGAGVAGAYTFADVPAGFAYTIAPEAGPVFSHTPASRSVTRLTAALAGQDFTAARKTYAVSGRVLLGADGLNGVVVQLKNSAGTVLANATTATSAAGVAGAYSFAGVPAGLGYTVAPAPSAVYSVTPASKTYENLSAAQAGQNFAAARKTYTVSGRVVLGTAGLNGVVVRLTSAAPGFAPRTVTTAATAAGVAGAYSFAGVPAGFAYTIAPDPGPVFSFTPASRSVTNLAAALAGQDFTAARKAYAIGGRVVLGTAGLDGVAVQLKNAAGAVIQTATTASTAAGGTGSYSFTGVPAGLGYTVAPASAVFSFTPASRAYANLSANQAAQNFTAVRRTYAVGGRVTLGGGGLNGVVIQLRNSAGTVLANATSATTASGAGFYTFASVPAGFTYSVTPAPNAVYSFTPPPRFLFNLAANQPAQDFAAARKTYTIAGRLLLGTASITGQVVQLKNSSGAVIARVNTWDPNTGRYEFTGVPAGFAYTVAPAPSAVYTYSPASKAVANLTASVVQNFAATRNSYTISGRVLKAGSTTVGIGGVTVTLRDLSTGVTRAVVTAADGGYSHAAVPAGISYSVTPSQTGVTFTPASKSYTTLSANQSGQNFFGP